METIDLIRAVASLVLFIVFIVMAYNISAIKKALAGDGYTHTYWLAQYNKHLAWGRNKEALHALQEAIWVRYRNEYFSTNEYEKLKAKWEPTVKDLGGNFLIKQEKETGF